MSYLTQTPQEKWKKKLLKNETLSLYIGKNIKNCISGESFYAISYYYYIYTQANAGVCLRRATSSPLQQYITYIIYR